MRVYRLEFKGSPKNGPFNPPYFTFSDDPAHQAQYVADVMGVPGPYDMPVINHDLPGRDAGEEIWQFMKKQKDFNKQDYVFGFPA